MNYQLYSTNINLKCLIILLRLVEDAAIHLNVTVKELSENLVTRVFLDNKVQKELQEKQV